MPIKPELRYFYPIDWPQISHWVRFVRAKGRCQVCGRPHGAVVRHLGDGRWWDEQQQAWRDGRGRKVPSPALTEDTPVRTTKVVLAAAHLDHDPAHCGRRHRNVRALCTKHGGDHGGQIADRHDVVADKRRHDLRSQAVKSLALVVIGHAAHPHQDSRKGGAECCSEEGSCHQEAPCRGA